MKKILTAAEMREVDRLTTERYAVPSLLLMENAASHALREIETRCAGGAANKHALIVCGRGNNGGDGAALARLLLVEGARTTVVLLGRADQTKGDARINFDIVRRLALQSGENPLSPNADAQAPPGLRAPNNNTLNFIECPTLEEWEYHADQLARTRFDFYVDAIFGTGLTRPAEGVQLAAINYLNSLRGRHQRGVAPLVVSLDLPSGLDADGGHLIGAAVRADLTITFTAPKPCNALAPASTLSGELVVADIGSPSELIDETGSHLFLVEAADAARWLRRTRYTPDSYKNTHGHALFVAGSRDMTGAAVLCADAAICAGAGLVTLATPASALPSIASRLMPEVMTAPLSETVNGAAGLDALEQIEGLAGRATVIAVGCGLSREDESTRHLVREMIERRTRPLILDADGLNALAPWPESLRGNAELPVILTPHEGEMLRLLDAKDHESLRDRARVASDFASRHSLLVVLKGTRTIIAAPDGRVFVNPTGNAGLGTAGSGDTLTGIIAAFLAQAFATLLEEADAVEAVVAAVYVAGLAGDLAARERGMRGMVASDVRRQLSAAFRTLDPKGETA